MSSNLTIFRKQGNTKAFMDAYEDVLRLWGIPYEEMMISTRFGETHIVAAGPKDAEPLILIHGMTFSATMWYPNVESIASNYRIYALDTIGDLGKGNVKRVMKSSQETVEWLDDILSSLNLSSAIFMGHSMGGWLSMNYAIHSPENVQKLILCAPAAGIHKVTPEFFFKVYPAIMFPSELRIRKELSWFLSPAFKGDDRSEKLIHQFIISGKNCVPCFRVIPSVFPDHKLKALSIDTLLLVGEHEVIYNPEKMIKKAKALLPNLTSQIIPNAGHGLTIEQHEIVNESVKSFLKIES